MVVEEKELEEQTTEDVTPDNVNETEAKEAAPEDAEQDQTSGGEADAAEVETAEEKPKKKSFLGKEKKEKTNKLQEKVDELEDRVKRQMAEFDNFRKRTDKEKSTMYEMGASEVIKKLLPVVDNFERGFKSITDEDKETPFAKGMDMVYKQIMKMFEDIDVKPIEAVGVEFNPEVHNAVMHIDDDSVGESIIVEEFEKGYTYKDTVIRHSMVKVAN